jgi:shikimate dehydrogenase
VIEHLDELGGSARLIGAVNCVVASGGRLVGENTDGQGFLDGLRTVLDPRGARAVVLGAGGAARAIAVELALAGSARLTIVNRDEARGSELCSLLEGEVSARVDHSLRVDFERWTGRHAVEAGADLLVNATSIGLPPDTAAEVPVDLDAMRGGSVVADVIPARDTLLLRRARGRRLRTLDGLGMLVAQGSLAVERWAGVSPDRAGMEAALVAAMGAEAAMA